MAIGFLAADFFNLAGDRLNALIEPQPILWRPTIKLLIRDEISSARFFRISNSEVRRALAPALMLDTSCALAGPMSVSCQSGRRPVGWCRDRCGEAGVKDVR